MNKKSVLITLFWLAFISWFIFLIVSCNPIQKAENKVLANIESVKRVRAVTDPLFPCSNDSVVFIHDSTEVINTEYQRDTLIDSRHDTTFVHYFDTTLITKTVTKNINTIVVDKREQNKLIDSINSLRLRESKLNGQVSEQRYQYEKMKGERNLWRIVAIILFAAIIAMGILKLKSIL